MPRTTVEFFEMQYGDLDDFLEDVGDFQESSIQEEIGKSWKRIEQSYYEELAEESEEYDVYRQDEDEEDGIF